MADASGSTPAPEEPINDKELIALAEYRDLGTDISELRSAVLARDMLEVTLLDAKNGAQMVRVPPGYTAFVLNPEEKDIIGYMRFHVGDLCRRLLEKFEAIEGGA